MILQSGRPEIIAAFGLSDEELDSWIARFALEGVQGLRAGRRRGRAG